MINGRAVAENRHGEFPSKLFNFTISPDRKPLLGEKVFCSGKGPDISHQPGSTQAAQHETSRGMQGMERDGKRSETMSTKSQSFDI